MNFDGIFFELDDYQLTDKFLGSGSFGKVFVVKCHKDNQNYAAKIIHVDSKKGFTGKDQNLLMRESIILFNLSHPSIVKFIGINFQSFTQPTKLEPIIITEYLPNGSLKDILDKEKVSLADHDWTPTKKYICLLGITSAMKYLHENGIIHRDLKPENILIDENFYPRICDFGLSRCFFDLISNSLKLTMTGQIGTPLYMAPELLMEDKGHYGPEVDVYAFSMLAYEIVTGKVPFSEILNGITPFGFANKVLSGYRPKFTNATTEKMQELISKCWSQNPSERPSFERIFEIISEDRSILGESVDDDEVSDFCENLNEEGAVKKIKKQSSENELTKLNDALCALICSIEGKKSDEIKVEELTEERILSLCKEARNSKCIKDIVGILLPETNVFEFLEVPYLIFLTKF